MKSKNGKTTDAKHKSAGAKGTKAAAKSKVTNFIDSGKIRSDEADFIQTYLKSDGSAVKTFFRLYKGHYGELALSTFFWFLKTSPVWILPIITANLIDLVTESKAGINVMPAFFANLIFAVIIHVQNIPTHTLHTKYFSKAKRSVEAGLRGAMVRKLQQLSISFHKEMETGRIQSKIMRDVENIELLSSQILITLLDIVVSVIVTCLVIIVKNPLIFLIFLVAVPVAAFSVMPFKNMLKSQNKSFHREIERTSANVMDMVALIPITRSHALENREINKMNKQLYSVANRGYELDVTNNLFGAVTWVVISLFNILCLAVCVYFAMKDKITIGDISIYTNYFSQLLAKVSSVIALIPIFSKGLQSVDSVGEILKSYDIEEYKNKKKITSLKGEFEFKNVFFHYSDDERLVLKDFNLTVKQGETIALVGESGSGKSTVVNMAIGLFTPTSGEITIDGKNIKDLDMHSVRKRIAVVPQNTILFNGTIKENITYGKPNVTKAELDKAIESANLKHVIDKLPDGINTDIGEHGGKLSGGQRQRISIARAIIRDPDVIIFDEATSALDTVSEAEIQAAINNLTKDRTTFIVAHRLSTIRSADKIAVVSNGHCVEYGTYDELMEKKGEFYRYKMTQS